jgi:hypothetical protein
LYTLEGAAFCLLTGKKDLRGYITVLENAPGQYIKNNEVNDQHGDGESHGHAFPKRLTLQILR